MTDILYKTTTRGKVLYWYVEVEDDTYTTVHGYCDEDYNPTSTIRSEPTVCQGKNIGKRTETTPEEQALVEARALYAAKLKESYHVRGEEPFTFFQPMLASEYNETRLLKTLTLCDKNLPKAYRNKFYVQPKLDGVRCVVQKVNGSVVCTSRSGKIFNHVGEHFSDINTHGLVLDGELYSEDIDFQTIVSLVRSDTNVKDLSALKLNLFDCYMPDRPDAPFVDRYRHMRKVAKHHRVTFVNTLEAVVTESFQENIKTLFTQMVANSEGMILRLNGPYENKRSPYLYKYKEFVTAEFPLVNFVEGLGNRAGTAASAVVDISSLGKGSTTSTVGVTGDLSTIREYWRKRDEYIGALLTVQYQNLTNDNKLRFGKGITFRDYE